MKGLTKKQTEILDYIHDFVAANRYSPTYREIGRHFNFSSVGTVHNHIQRLKKKGVLSYAEAASRSITPSTPPRTKEIPNEVSIPIAGYITAHSPIKTFSTIRMVSVPHTMVSKPDATYALKIQGTAFLDELINDGDLLIVEARQEANPGETVVALVNDVETIIGRFYPDGYRMKLMSVKSMNAPLIISNDDCSIQGIVLGLMRSY